ncbi:MAG: DUF1015 family protein [Bacteroidia bacterium]|nr:DUF1015 domain-containing protein [Bacteroidia bacterium]MCZ2277636.1 DUF1015 family protein [Bacteroidia bacterium]
MAYIKPFKGIRPKKELVQRIACRPYDVLDTAEARLESKGDSLSFYHVIKPEIDFPDGFDPYSSEIYKKGIENFRRMQDAGAFITDSMDCYYLYSQSMPADMIPGLPPEASAHTQFGFVGCASIDDYFNDIIKKHELTRPDKEEDRKNHVRASRLNYEPVFFAYPQVKSLDNIINQVSKETPEYHFTSDDRITHSFWVISDPETIQTITKEFSKIKYTYVADGHHRTAAAALVGKELRAANPAHQGNEEYNYFLAVHFPDNQLQIMDYNRVIKDLNGLSVSDFISRIKDRFEVAEKGNSPYRPARLHELSMYLEGKWYSLTAKPGTYHDSDPIGVLDVTILSEQVLTPLLNITDLRKDKRIDFVGGLRGLTELQRRVDSGEMKVAFALYPVTMKQLIAIADTGNIMPPKTTWFEPKLRSGLVLHSLD